MNKDLKIKTFLLSGLLTVLMSTSPTAVNAAEIEQEDIRYPTFSVEEKDTKGLQTLTIEKSNTEYLIPTFAPQTIQIEEPKVVPPEDFKYEDSRFDIKKTIDLAYAEVGTTRPTGWNQEGECIMAVKRWLTAGGATWGPGGTPVGNYTTATIVSIEEARPGDVVQYIYSASPSSWATGIHTVLITGVNPDGTFKIVESNNPGGSGLVSKNDNWTPTPPQGFEAHFYRF